MKATIYAGYSSDNQREESIEAQIRAINESVLDLFDTLIVHKLDRFSINKYDSAFYKKI